MGDYKQEDCILMTEIKTSKDTMKLTKNFIYFSHVNNILQIYRHYEPSILFKQTTLLASSNPLESFIYFSHINSSHHFTYWQRQQKLSTLLSTQRCLLLTITLVKSSAWWWCFRYAISLTPSAIEHWFIGVVWSTCVCKIHACYSKFMLT